VAANPELVAIQSEFMGPGNTAEMQQARSYLMAFLQLVQQSIFLRRDALLDDSIWRTRANFAIVNLRTELGLASYERFKQAGTLAPEFTEWLDAELARQDPEPNR
jgi:hypothetical protein